MRIWNPTTDTYDMYGEASNTSDYLADMTAFGGSLIDDADAVAARSTLGINATWQTYTPTWTTDGTAPSLGNGSLSGTYLWQPHLGLLIFYINFVAGSTTTYGTNGWHFTTPPGFSITGAQVVVGNMFDASAVVVRAASAITSGTQLSNVAHGSGFITNTSPMSWAVNDTLSWSGAVRATSP